MDAVGQSPSSSPSQAPLRPQARQEARESDASDVSDFQSQRSDVSDFTGHETGGEGVPMAFSHRQESWAFDLGTGEWDGRGSVGPLSNSRAAELQGATTSTVVVPDSRSANERAGAAPFFQFHHPYGAQQATLQQAQPTHGISCAELAPAGDDGTSFDLGADDLFA